MKLIYCVLLLLCPYVSLTQAGNSAVKPGEFAPDIRFDNILNSHFTQVKLSGLPGKLIVLDFMTTTCAGCIKALPGIDSLQRLYKNDVQVLLVSVEKKERILQYLKKRPGLQLPFVAEGIAYKDYFPHEYISHLVWLDSNRKLIAITGSDYFTGKNIEAALKGDTRHWPVKNDSISSTLAAADALPLYQNEQKELRQLLWPNNPAYPTGWQFITDTVANKSRLEIANKPLLYYYMNALGLRRLPLTQVRSYGIDDDMLWFNASRHLRAAWERAFAFSYEAEAAPAITKEQHFNKMLQSLQQYFGMEAQLKDSCVEVYALREKNALLLPMQDEAYKKLPGIFSIMENLNKRMGGMPVVDDRIHRKNISLPFAAPLPTHPMLLNDFLAAYNLELIPATAVLPILVLRKSGPSNFLSPAKTYLK